MFGDGKKTGKFWLRVDPELSVVVRAINRLERRQIQETVRDLIILGAHHRIRRLGNQLPDQIRLMASNGVQR